MKAGIIAAGEGSRLKSEGITAPKPLVMIDGIPLIERLIAAFIRCGITEIVCIVNEQSLAVKEYVESRAFPVRPEFVVRTTASSMHSLFALAPHLQDDRFLLSTVDSIFNEREFENFRSYGEQSRSVDGVLAVTDFVDDENPLYVEMNDKRRILAFRKMLIDDRQPVPPPPGRKDVVKGNTWVTGGLYVFSPRIFREITTVLDRRIERLRNFLTYLIERGYVLEGYPFSKIVDVDHVADIKTAERLLGSPGVAIGDSN